MEERTSVSRDITASPKAIQKTVCANQFSSTECEKEDE